MLSKQKRLDRKTFLTVLERGKTVHSPYFSLKYKDFPGISGFSVVVPKAAFKKAVDRNKFRRRAYSLIGRHTQAPSLQVIIFMKKEVKNLDMKGFYQELTSFLGKNRIIKG